MYCYNGNNIVHFDFYGNRVIDWSRVGDPDFPEDLENWDNGLISWHHTVLIDMAEEFHDSEQVCQLPENLQQRIAELREIGCSARNVGEEIRDLELTSLENFKFGNLDLPPDWPEQIKKAFDDMIDKMIIEEDRMWDDLQINGVIPDDLEYL